MNTLKKHCLFKAWLAVVIIGFISGCSLPLRYLVGGGKAVRIPQVVTHLEPSLKDNQIAITGKIILENPTESDLALDKILLTVKNDTGEIISDIQLDWDQPHIKSRGQIESPVEFLLPLGILNYQAIQISLKTSVFYKVMAIRIPIESEIAVFHLAPLRNSLTGPLQVVIYTKITPDIRGDAVVTYRFEIVNPFNVDLWFENGEFKVYTVEKGEIGRTRMANTLLGSKKETLIEGEFIIKNIFRDLFIDEFVKGHAIREQLTGKLRLPQTDIFVPFKAEAVQEIDYSLFSNFKR